MTDLETIRRQLSNQLFVGFGDDATSSPTRDTRSTTGDGGGAFGDKFNERLLLNVKVSEDAKAEDGKGKATKGRKVRFICVTVKKNMKIRIHKVKQGKAGNFSIGKTWGLDDIKSIESAEDTQVIVNLGKTYKWYLDDMHKKLEFLFTLVKLCRKYLKRPPKFINVDEESLKAQMQLNATYLSATEKEFTATFATMAQRPRGVVLEEEEEEEDVIEEQDPLPIEPEAPSLDMDEVLNDFNWEASGDAAALEARLISELHALEAANVHAIISSEEQANKVVSQLDHAIWELDQIDEWISRYTHLLDSMGQDVHQIEVRHKGMQIASHNQKLLLAEVEAVLGSLRIPAYIVEILRTEPLDDNEGIAQCEDATRKLMDVTQSKFDEDMNNLQAVKEQIALLNGYGNQFATRLHDHLIAYFQSQAEAYLQDKGRTSKKGSLKLYGHEAIEERLYRFCRLLKWLKDVDTRKHFNLQMAYVQEMGRVYIRDIHEFIEQFKLHHMQRKLEAEGQDYAFSVPTVSVSSAASNALKSAIKGSQNNLLFANSPTSDRPGPAASMKQKLDSYKSGGHRHKKSRDSDSYTDSLKEEDSDDAASIRSHRRGGSESMGRASAIMNSLISLEVGADERMAPDEALGHTLSLLLPVIVREQNFITDLFSLHKGTRLDTTGSTADLVSPASEASDEVIQNWQELLSRPREPIKDLKLSKRIQELVQGIFDDVREEILLILDAGLKGDQTFAVGMMVRVEEYIDEYKDTCHTYNLLLLEEINKKLVSMFERFLEDQTKSIDETKVTSKKRSGILSFIRTFPKFVDRVEKCLGGSTGPARRTVNQAYARIVKTMLETLDAMAQQVANDTKAAADDKEHLNIHILHVEVRARKVPSLDPYVKQAKSTYDVHLDAYCKVVIRKPLGKLWDFFEGIEGLLKTNTPEEVNYHMQYNKSALKEVVRKYPGKEIKKGLESLYKRVEKHYTDEEGLLQVVWRGIQEEFTKRFRRYGELIMICYPETSTRLEFTMDELLGYFSELARAH
ncbi:hypothetical protein SpCBS45565_g06534 [Spizellomyces sp. 'palustris']|nr:hypothetical protein SpCBS45565_g06534 [Spizellomyces sp. 'palustris']